MRHLTTFALAAGLLAAPVFSSSAAQFHLPLHLPPQRFVPKGGSGTEFRVGGGAAAASAPGIKVSGPGALWEYAGYGSGGTGFSARGYGFGLSGEVDPFSVGHKDGGGLAGGFEMDILRAPRGKDSYRLYTGFIAGLTILDVREPLLFQYSGGKFKAEPDTAFSMFVGFPVGVLTPVTISGSWRGELQADITVFPAGVTFFSYGGLASPVYGESRGIDFLFSGGVRAGFVYVPWNLSLEALGRLSSASGNNEPVPWGAALASLKLF